MRAILLFTGLVLNLILSAQNVAQNYQHHDVTGIRIGKSNGGFAEFGFGYKGIINLGLSFQLD
jgi:hypothetical protein